MTDLFKVLPMTAAHLDEVVRIEALSFYEPWSSASVESSLSKDGCFVAVDSSDTVVGYLIFSYIFDEGELLRIAAHPLHKRKGIPSLLIRQMLNEAKARNIKHWFLEVRASNSPAIRIYEKFGFTVMGRRKSYYKGPHGKEDAITMHLNGS